jgi:hypothetical protein
MGISRHIFAAVLTCCALGSLQAVDPINQDVQTSKKVYVDSHHVKAIPQGIIVVRGKHAFLVKSVRSDHKGLFFLKKDRINLVAKGKKEYICDVCGKRFTKETDLLWHHVGHASDTDAYDD